MRWESLFTDLEAELDGAQAAELDTELRDRVRRELATLRLADRLREAVGHALVAYSDGGGAQSGRLAGCGPDWLLLADQQSRDLLVPFSALLGVTGLGRRSAPPGDEGVVGAGLDLRHALRGLGRGRLPVAVVLRDRSIVHGTIDRVGADFMEVAEHPPGEARRDPAVTGVRTIPLAALAVVRSG